MKSITTNLNMAISTTFSFDEDGLRIYQYYDLGSSEDDVGQEIKMSYKDVEDSYFESIVYNNEGKECINPELDEHEWVKSEIENLEKFTKSLRGRLESAVKNHNDRIEAEKSKV